MEVQGLVLKAGLLGMGPNGRKKGHRNKDVKNRRKTKRDKERQRKRAKLYVKGKM